MQLPRNLKRNFVARSTMILFAALTLSTAVATDALAAGHGGGRIGGGTHIGHMGRGFRGPLVDSIPAAPGPTFNPSSPYTVPQAGETPVSPGSPGSVFGDR
jgi:uncharacterized membrane protein